MVVDYKEGRGPLMSHSDDVRGFVVNLGSEENAGIQREGK